VARTADRKLTLVLDRDDDVADLARLRRLHARPFGQIVCEPAPGGGSAGLAHALLAALGKTLDPESCRDPLWCLVDVHLRAECVRNLIVLRAHKLTYPALRRLADHAHAAGVQLWLVVHRERPPAPVAQLLEAFPHETASLQALLEHAPGVPEPDSGEDLPFGAGLEFPYLSAIHDVFNPLPRRRVRLTLTRGLPRRDRAVVYDAWDQAHAWMPGGSTSTPAGPTRTLPTASTRSPAAATPPRRSTCASAPRSTPSTAPASTPTSTRSIASSSTALARPDPASSTPPSPAPRRWPTRRRTPSSPR
jgi:hypothetical protein